MNMEWSTLAAISAGVVTNQTAGDASWGPAPARSVVEAFVNARFSEEDRHRRRLEKVARLENSD
ncbi:MAG: hypothetical protein AAF471_08520 [Myxococcota bacterium]